MPFTMALPHAPQPNRSFNADANMQSITSLMKGFCKGHYDYDGARPNWLLAFKKYLNVVKF